MPQPRRLLRQLLHRPAAMAVVTTVPLAALILVALTASFGRCSATPVRQCARQLRSCRRCWSAMMTQGPTLCPAAPQRSACSRTLVPPAVRALPLLRHPVAEAAVAAALTARRPPASTRCLRRPPPRRWLAVAGARPCTNTALHRVHHHLLRLPLRHLLLPRWRWCLEALHPRRTKPSRCTPQHSFMPVLRPSRGACTPSRWRPLRMALQVHHWRHPAVAVLPVRHLQSRSPVIRTGRHPHWQAWRRCGLCAARMLSSPAARWARRRVARTAGRDPWLHRRAMAAAVPPAARRSTRSSCRCQ